MVQRIQLPRLSRTDVEGLMRAHQFVEQIVGALRGTNWAGAAACIALAGNVDVVLCQLYNKAEHAILGDQASSPPESPGEASPTAAAPVASVDDQKPRQEPPEDSEHGS